MPNVHSVQGKVIRSYDLAPGANLTVRLITQAAYLREAANRTLLPAGQVDWTCSMTDLTGSRWDCWEKHIDGKIPITWADFRDNALVYNPHLAEDGRIFDPEKTYLMPEVSPPQEVAWSRSITGFSGSRWDCWEKYIDGNVPISWPDFRDNALVHNPHLAADGRVYQPSKTYIIPDVIGTARAALTTTTDGNGFYRFDGIVAGAGCLIEVTGPGATPRRVPIMVNGDLNEPITINGGGTGMRSALPNYAAIPAQQRAIIDQAISMLGDERSTFDALPPELQKLCYGASPEFINNPNSMYYKDIVCADLVTIAMVAAGFQLNWPGLNGSNPHMAHYFMPGNAGVQEITDANDWQPGDVLVYGNVGSTLAGHVNLYVGPYQGTDRSGKTYALSANNDVVEASMNFDMSNGQRWGLGNIACTRRQCLDGKRGYQWVRRVRLKAVAALLG